MKQAKGKGPVVIQMHNNKLPRFIVQETSEDLFVFCLELHGVLRCWQTTHPPSMDTQFRRRLHEMPEQPLNNLEHEGKVKELGGESVTIWDTGTYSVGKLKHKKQIEDELAEGLTENRVELILDGKELKGKFSVFYDGRSKRWFIHKLKDAHVETEDILGFDLERSVRKIAPDYDPDGEEQETETAKPEGRRKTKTSKEAHPEKELDNETEAAQSEESGEDLNEESPDSNERGSNETPIRVGFSAEIKSTLYHFRFFKSIDPRNDETVCLVQQEHGPSFLMIRKDQQWEIETSVPAAIVRKEPELSAAIGNFLQQGQPE